MLNQLPIGKCSLCGGLVTVPMIWHGINPPPKTCSGCGAEVDEAANLKTLPMKQSPGIKISSTGSQ